MSSWICETCGKPITDNDGFVILFNNKEERGQIGGYPMEATPEPAGGDLDLVDAVKLLQEKPSIGITAHHAGECDPYPDGGPYSISLKRADTLEKWCSWVIHLFEKTWMGRSDLERLLGYWWENRGENPHNLA